jgi:hypothetical protein
VELTVGAARVAEVLAEAVAVRTSPGGMISADLSGGLDSTPPPTPRPPPTHALLTSRPTRSVD